LRTLTGVNEWALGGAKARPDPATLDAATAPAVADGGAPTVTPATP